MNLRLLVVVMEMFSRKTCTLTMRETVLVKVADQILMKSVKKICFLNLFMNGGIL